MKKWKQIFEEFLNNIFSSCCPVNCTFDSAIQLKKSIRSYWSEIYNKWVKKINFDPTKISLDIDKQIAFLSEELHFVLFLLDDDEPLYEQTQIGRRFLEFCAYQGQMSEFVIIQKVREVPVEEMINEFVIIQKVREVPLEEMINEFVLILLTTKEKIKLSKNFKKDI
jgi:hypothetical protein